MSTTIDEKVVEMRFDNQNFEHNARTSMSTLAKLKQSLKLDGAAKGLDEIDSAAKKINMPGLGSAVDAVSVKFSALQVMGVTALANITNQAVNAGKRIVSALTIDPVKTGFQEYETQINAVQTILANTQSKGSTIEDVNKALDELNKYADLTIYNFTEMTRNIGTFTAAGIDLETSVSAIQGIANLAAVSGSTSQQASTAMYQLSQALASGTVKLMDWNSVVNAGMGGQVFQDALKKTSELLGTGAEAAIEAEGSFRESLTTGWLTADVLTETLKKFTTSGANEYVAEYTGLSKEAVEASLKEAKAKYGEAEAIEYASKALAEKSGKNADEIKSVLEMANTATDAATKVKTFSQLWDVMKEAAQSGWSKTWQIIIGDFEEAKELLTPLSDFFIKIIDRMSDARNNLLESALGKSFIDLAEKVKGTLKPIQNTADSIKEVANSVKDYATVVNEIMGGKWGNGQSRWDKLAEAGYDWAHAQNLVNEKLGDSTRHATDYKEAQNGVTEAQDKTTKSTEKLTDAEKKQIIQMASMLEDGEKSKKLTKEQVDALTELVSTADKLGMSVEDFVNNIDEIDGRWLIIDSFKNAGKGLLTVFQAIGKAWRQAFHGDATDEQILNKKTEAIFNMIAAIHKFSTKLIVSDEAAKNITRTFKGLFAIIDVITTIAGGGLKIAFKVLSQVLSAFDMDILDLTGNIGDALVKFRDWLFENNALAKSINKLIDKIPGAIEVIKGWIKAFLELPAVQKAMEKFDDVFDNIVENGKDFLDGFVTVLVEKLPEAISKIKQLIDAFLALPKVQNTLKIFKDGFESAITFGVNFIEGFINGLKDGALQIPNILVDICKMILDLFAGNLGEHSPSVITHENGVNFVQGFINGVKEMVSKAVEVVKDFASKVVEYMQNIDWSKILALGVAVSMVWFVKKVGDALDGIASAFEGFGAILDNVAAIEASISKVLNGISWDFKAKAIRNLAIALAILVGSIVLLVKVGGDDYGKLWNAVGVISVLAVILVGLAFAMNKLSEASVSFEKGKGLNINGLKTGLIAIGASILMLAAAAKLIGSMDPDEATRGFLGLAGMVGVLALVFAAYGKLIKGKAAQNMDKLGGMLLKLSFAMLLMVGVCKLAGMLSIEEMLKGAAFAEVFVLFFLQLTAITKLSGKGIDKLGGMMIKISIAMLLMVGVCKLAGKLSAEEMLKGAAFALAFVGFLALLVKATKIGKEDQIAKLGGLLLSISISMMLMVGVCKLVSQLSAEEALKGAAFVAAFVIFVKYLVGVLKIGNEEKMARVASTILAMSVAIGVMAGAAILLSWLSLSDLAKGVTAVSILGLIMAQMAKAAKDAQNCKGTIIAMTVAIAVMVASVALLSLIDVKDLVGPVAALSLLMGMFAVMVRSAKDVKGSLPTIIIMTAVVAAFAGILWWLSIMKVDNAIKNAGALSLLMLAMSGVITALGKVKIGIKDALVGVLALTVLAVPMFAFVYVLQRMSGVQNAVTNATILAALMTVMTLLLIPLTVIGKMWIGALVGVLALTAMAKPMLAFVDVLQRMSGVQNAVTNATTLVKLMTVMTLLLIPLTLVGYLWIGAAAGLIALTAMTVPMRAFVGVLAVMNQVQNASKNATFLIALMTVMVNLLTQLAIIGPLAIVGVTALAGLEVLMASLGGIVLVMGALADKIGPLIDSGLPLMIKLAGGIGEMVGAFVDGLLVTATANLPQVGKNLSDFMVYATGFITGAKLIDEKVVDGVKCLTSALIALTAAELVNGIAQFISQGGISFKQLGTDLSDFMSEASGFIEGAKKINQSVIDGTNALATLIMTLTKAELINRISSFASILTGKSDMSAFGTQLTAFGEAMKAFSDSITGDNAINVDAVAAAANAGKLLVELTNSLPKTGGKWQEIAGEQDLGLFGRKCAAFGLAMKLFSNSISGDNAIDSGAIEAAAKAGQLMSELVNSLPKTGGIWQNVAGEQDIGLFGLKCVAFGAAMKLFSDTISGDNAINTDAIEAASKAGELMSKLQDTLPKTGGVWQSIAGEQDIAEFGRKCAAFGQAMVGFPTINISDETITSISKAGMAVAEIQKILPKEDGFLQKIVGQKDIEGFATACKTFSQALTNLKYITISDENIESITRTGVAMRLLQQILPREDGLLQKIAGQKDIEAFANGCLTFSKALRNLSSFSISEDTVASISNTGNMLVELQKSIPGSRWLDGKVNLEEFGGQISTFKNALTKISAFSITEETIESVNRTGNMLIDLQKAIPGTSWLDGKVNLEEFGVSIGKFAKGIKTLSEFSMTEDAIVSVDNTGRMLIALQKAIPESTWLDGKVELDEFGKKIKSFGGHLAGYSEKVSEIDFGAVSASLTQSRKFIYLANSLVDLDLSGIENFKIKSLGSALKGYYNKIDEIDFGVVSSSISQVMRLKSLVQSLAGLDNSGIESFTIKSIGSKLKGYYEAVSGIDTGVVSTSISNANRLRIFIGSLAGLDASGVGSFKTAVNELGTVDISKIVSAFEGASATLYSAGAKIITSVATGMRSRLGYLLTTATSIVTQLRNTVNRASASFKSAGVILMTQFSIGISSQKGRVSTSARGVVSAAVSTVNNHYINFYSAGKNLVEGFALGITANTFRAEAQAAAMAEAAKRAAEKALGINSPSKVFYKIGGYTGQGFVNALVDYGKTAYDSASSMADYARKGMTSAIGRIQDLINSDMDSQPTIRPVLDLSDVQSGVAYMNGLLPNSASIGVMSNLNSISSMMNRNNQNGEYGEVVSAIEGLRKDLGNTGDTYIIDGVTYDDGSAVSNAMQTIVRAAKIERRV